MGNMELLAVSTICDDLLPAPMRKAVKQRRPNANQDTGPSMKRWHYTPNMHCVNHKPHLILFDSDYRNLPSTVVPHQAISK